MLGSAVLSVVWVASGRADAYYIGLAWKDNPKAWDWCAATAIGRAVGVTFLRFDERSAPFEIEDNHNLCCAGTPELAGQLADLLHGSLEASLAREAA